MLYNADIYAQEPRVEVVDGLAANGEDGNGAVEAKVKAEVAELCARFPLYPNL